MLTLLRHPHLFPIAVDEIRHASIRRFPFEIFYEPTDDCIIVYSVFHCSQDPKSGGNVSDTNRNGNIPEPLAGPCNHPQLQPERVASPCNLTPATASGHCVTTQSTSARARAHCRALQSTPAREIADCTATQSAKAAPEADCVLNTVTFKPISDRFLQETAFFRQVIQRPGAHPSRVLSTASSRRSPHFGWKPK